MLPIVRWRVVVAAWCVSLVSAPTAAGWTEHEDGEATGLASCALPARPGRDTLTINSGGLVRSYILYVPSGYDGRHRLPLVLNLHGSQSTAEEQMSISALEATAERHTFLLAAPQARSPLASGARWNVPGVTIPAPGEALPNDEQFLNDLINELQASRCVDARRVYATGFSGGGRMISQFAYDSPDAIAAIAPVVGLRAGFPRSGPSGPEPDPATCAPERPVPVRTFAGTADQVNPFLGGGAPYWQYGALAALQRWAEINRCERLPRTRDVTEHVSLIGYAGCRRNATVEMYVVEGGGHTWPGSDLPLPQLGFTTHEISASELMWEFFDERRAQELRQHAG